MTYPLVPEPQFSELKPNLKQINVAEVAWLNSLLAKHAKCADKHALNN